MAKTKWQPAWCATVSIEIPISADDPATAATAKAAVEMFAKQFPTGSVVAITRATYGKMAVAGGE